MPAWRETAQVWRRMSHNSWCSGAKGINAPRPILAAHRTSLNGTALVYEVYVSLVDQQQSTWQNRAQFFGLACQVMRNILVDHARNRNRLKRGGGAVQLRLSEAIETHATFLFMSFLHP